MYCNCIFQICRQFDSPKALLRAKYNVEKYYPVVGVLEKFNETLRVLEEVMPQYFKGASNVDYTEGYKKEKLFNSNRPKPPRIMETTKLIMKANMTHEFEFYEFCVQRLQNQFDALIKPK